MKRTKSANPDIKRFRKIGGGSLTFPINGRMRIIKPGEVFSATLEEIPENFRDVIVPLGGVKYKDLDNRMDSIDVRKLKYTLRGLGGGWFDVVDVRGKTVNEKALRKTKAEKLIEDLTAE